MAETRASIEEFFLENVTNFRDCVVVLPTLLYKGKLISNLFLCQNH